eukprot:7767213-Alexandrium_andersonii.AAC.1
MVKRQLGAPQQLAGEIASMHSVANTCSEGRGVPHSLHGRPPLRPRQRGLPRLLRWPRVPCWCGCLLIPRALCRGRAARRCR